MKVRTYKTIMVILIVLIIVALGFVIAPKPTPPPVVVTMPVEMPAQEQVTPIVESSPFLVAGINRGASTQGVVVVPKRVVQDSRCPMNARCAQAGTLIVETDVVVGTKTKTILFDLTKTDPVIFEGHTVRLVAAVPDTVTGETVAPEQYAFSFEVRTQ